MSEAKKFVFKSTPGIVTWPCKISEPVDGGKRDETTITVRFRVLAQERIEEAFPPLAIIRDPAASRKFMDEAVDGFDDLVDEQKQKVDGPEVKAGLLSNPYVLDGLISGYFDMIGRRVTKN